MTTANISDIIKNGQLVELDDETDAIVVTADIVGEGKTVPSIVDVLSTPKDRISESIEAFGLDRYGEKDNSKSKVEVTKFVLEGDTDKTRPIASGEELTTLKLNEIPVVSPPYPPEVFAQFLQVDETHFRAVKTKAVDSVGRDWMLLPKTNSGASTLDDFEELEEKEKKELTASIKTEIAEIRAFIENANDVEGFEGVLEQAATDYEGTGWGAIEIVRSLDGKIAKMSHIPADRIRVIRGWRGFIELGSNGKKIYHQMFGDKLVSKNNKIPGTTRPIRYDPSKDGKIEENNWNWNFINRKNGEKGRKFGASANEILYCPKCHPATIYYGLPDIVPALGQLIANIFIRDYLLQFFEHNTIPQYAIVVEGGKLAGPTLETIQKYFTEEIKGKAHKTLIISVPSTGGEVKIRFEKLAADEKEGSFQETKKNNVQSILTAHGVSPAILGIVESANLGSGKGLSQAEIYKDRIVTPLQKKWARHINKLFRLGLGITQVRLEFDPLDIRDLHNEMLVVKGYHESGIINTDEARERVRIGGPVEGGNEGFIRTARPGITRIKDIAKDLPEPEINTEKKEKASKEPSNNNNNSQE